MSANSSSLWRIVGASVRGSSHSRAGQVCQDAFAVAALPSGAMVAAVADGAGSAPFSEIGSALAVETVIATIRGSVTLLPHSDRAGWERLLTEAVERAQESIRREAEARTLHPSDLAATLLVSVVTPDVTAILQIGDGAMVGQDEDGTLFSLTTPQNGEYANTTVFLTSPDALATAQFGLHPPCTHLALFSDGLQRLALDMTTGQPHPPFFQPLFRFLSAAADSPNAETELTAFLNSPRVQERSDDDLTLVLASRLNG